jgi:metallo-beta-lactamase class B
MVRLALALLFAASMTGAVAAQTAEQRPLWNAEMEPCRIFGPLYYVGTKELASFAIATPEGLIVLDGGLPESAPRVVASLETLGKRMDQVKILLNSHAHFDHAGGLAELAAKSGARVEASAADYHLPGPLPACNSGAARQDSCAPRLKAALAGARSAPPSAPCRPG